MYCGVPMAESLFCGFVLWGWGVSLLVTALMLLFETNQLTDFLVIIYTIGGILLSFAGIAVIFLNVGDRTSGNGKG
jgi:hypothetical protein